VYPTVYYIFKAQFILAKMRKTPRFLSQDLPEAQVLKAIKRSKRILN